MAPRTGACLFADQPQPIPLSPLPHPVLTRLRNRPERRPLVVAHRGDSRHHPENTIAAFRAAARLGVPMQEFDVRQLACGTLVCVHDGSFDRTTDAARRLGPGARVAGMILDTVRTLDAGSWFDTAHAGERVPTLAEVLEVVLPDAIAMIEHKAGDPDRYVAALRAPELVDRCLLQSFDWHFLAAARSLAPDVAIGVLGPNHVHQRLGRDAIEAALALGAGLVPWRAQDIQATDVQRVHEAGLLLCTYTTDEPLGWLGGATMGIDAMCTNEPAAMLTALSHAAS